jgi:predicted transposase/invertase (TIGR01784 family)
VQTDSLFYRLFQHWPQLALDLLQLPCAADSYQFGSEEIKQTGFRIDGLFKPLDSDRQLPLIFAEVQYQPDQEFYGRFYSEIMLYLYRKKPDRAWLALVIYPNRAAERPPRTEFAHFLAAPQLKRVYLEDYVQTDQPGPGHGLLKLIACPAEATVQVVQTLTQQHGTLHQNMLEFIETVLVYKLPQLSREEIRAMLGLDVQLKQTRFYQEIAEEERREGKQEGLLEGLLEGQLKGETALLIRLLSKRFGPLPAWVEQHLAQATIEQLDVWGERILDANTLAEVFD